VVVFCTTTGRCWGSSTKSIVAFSFLILSYLSDISVSILILILILIG
jgi:hypothetical protein